MYSELEQRVARLVSTAGLAALGARRIGLEREALRVDADGAISRQAHPPDLGAALTHPAITTDFSEALVEMVTPPCASAREAIEALETLHRFVLPRLPEGERLWNASMPCRLPADSEAIPIGRYGSSHQGRMKHVYRRGLGVRYGRRMQTIAGIHFNFSLPDEAWPLWRELHRVGRGASSDAAVGITLADARESARTRGLFSMLQNLQRVGWLVPYLFGASPAICASFLEAGEASDLERLGEGTRYAGEGCSLRMGNIGYRYRDDAPVDLGVCHERFDRYVEDIVGHVTNVHPHYAELGLYDAAGERQQLSACRLQIENEYYSAVRPKQIPERGEMPILALARRGIAYLELRSVDIDPEEPVGIGAEQCAALELLMLFAWLADERPLDAAGLADATHNVRLVAHRGRESDLVLRGPEGPIGLRDWGLAVLDALVPLADALDASAEGDRYARALAAQREKLERPERTPAARALGCVREAGSFVSCTLERSAAQRRALLERPLDAARERELTDAVSASVAARERLESASKGSLESFLDAYFAQIRPVAERRVPAGALS